MNYKMHYDSLIKRAKTRTLTQYTERHHIVPKCLGGNDSIENLVDLLPEEHFIAHQLLVKMHPNNAKLIFALNMMTVSGSKTIRSNKRYGWIKRQHQNAARSNSSGTRNSQYGSCWIYDPTTLQNKKIAKNKLELYTSIGWIKGRHILKEAVECLECRKNFRPQGQERLCSEECKDKRTKTASYHGREQELLGLYEVKGSLNAALKEMGYPGAVSHWHRWAKEVISTS